MLRVAKILLQIPQTSPEVKDSTFVEDQEEAYGSPSDTKLASKNEKAE